MATRLTTAEVLEHLARTWSLTIEPATWRSYVARGQAPRPDDTVGRTPLWSPATIDEWAEGRPGQGARTDRPIVRHDDNVSLVHRAHAAELVEVVRRTTLVGQDAWGVEHRVPVAWRAQIVEGAMLAQENVGRVPVVWLDTPPCHLVRSFGGGLDIATNVVRVTGDRQEIVEGRQVDSDDELDQGCFTAGDLPL